MTLVQARNYTHTDGRAIDLIVIHDMEAPEGPSTAENVANWFAGSTAPRASAHRCFDENSNVQCVRDQDVAWHAPGVNHNSLGYEHAGFARQTRDEWLDESSTATLHESAMQAAVDCITYAIPVAFVDADGILRGERGITTHLEVSRAYPGRGDHWDPGFEFPMPEYLGWVAEAQGGAVFSVPVAEAPAPDKSTQGPRLLRVGSVGDDVKDWQRIFGLTEDGIFGPLTAAAVRRFQNDNHLKDDGVIGPLTAQAMADALAALSGMSAAPAPDAAPVAVEKPILRRNDKVVVEAVKELQAHFPHLAQDGIFGRFTEVEVEAFQKHHGLAVDGIVGPLTWAALDA